ncbi:ribosome-associated protein YbcJ [Providencia rettgeri]|uniref:ribosome-associated protein YbcJ n=1 Tax=Providencia rettgeri TaxID=587 RepID=UPI0025A834D5|nr:ribosome-associated protein YbcJ [Providencia rettgeri]ELR5222519.1 ribosome-associated protein YbcJ [Providencia rettgeri]MDX7322337.1 ribosome-associated protein YbcJ [Providencia rettgeri]
MDIFNLNGHPHVELCDLLKIEGWAESGAMTKAMIADGLVEVDGVVETRKRCKIVAGKIVSMGSEKIKVVE